VLSIVTQSAVVKLLTEVCFDILSQRLFVHIAPQNDGAAELDGLGDVLQRCFVGLCLA
jgi:hypothetical protein